MPIQTAPATNNNPKNLFAIALDLSKNIGNDPIIKDLKFTVGIDLSKILDAAREVAVANFATEVSTALPDQSAETAESVITQKFGNVPPPEPSEPTQELAEPALPPQASAAPTPGVSPKAATAVEAPMMEGDTSQFPTPETTPPAQRQHPESRTPEADELAELMEEVQGPAELGPPPVPSGAPEVAPAKTAISAPPPAATPAESAPKTVFNPYTEEREPAPPGGLPPGVTPRAPAEEAPAGEAREQRPGTETGGSAAGSEQQQAVQLQREQAEERQKQIEQGTFDADKFQEQEKNRLETAGATGTPKERLAAKAGAGVGKKLRKGIEEGDFRYFTIAIGLAVFKDMWDMGETLVDGGLMGTLMNLFVSAILYYIIYSQDTFVQGLIQKYFKNKVLYFLLAKLVPFLNFVPFYTFLIIGIKRRADQERREREREGAAATAGENQSAKRAQQERIKAAQLSAASQASSATS